MFIGRTRSVVCCGTSSTPQGCTAVAGLYIPPATRSNSRLPRDATARVSRAIRSGPRHEPSAGSYPTFRVWCDPCVLRRELFSIALAVGLAWGPPARSQTPPVPVLPARPPADTDTLRRPPRLPGRPSRVSSLPLELNLRVEAQDGARPEPRVQRRSRRLRSARSRAATPAFCPGRFNRRLRIKSAGHRRRPVARQRRLRHAARVRRVERRLAVLRRQAGLATRSASTSATSPSRRRRRAFSRRRCRAATTALQAIDAVRPLRVQVDLRAADGQRRSEPPVHDRRARAQQTTDRDIEDYQIEPPRFFFTVDPALFGGGVSEHRHSEPLAARRACAARCRTRCVRRACCSIACSSARSRRIPNGPRFRCRATPARGTQTYDLLREGVDYYMDRSHALVRARPPAQRDQRAARRRVQRAHQRPRHGLDDDRRHARPPVRDRRATKSRTSSWTRTVGPTSPAFRQRDPLGLSHRRRRSRARARRKSAS